MTTMRHGEARREKATPEYRAWQSMKARCGNKNRKFYENYGGRNIRVCKRWINSFETFLSDMGRKPEGTSLDRIDNNGNYEPNNCRWASKKQQARNARSNRIIDFNGQNKSLAQWADETGIPSATLGKRLEHGWPINRAMTAPVRRMSNNVQTQKALTWPQPNTSAALSISANAAPVSPRNSPREDVSRCVVSLSGRRETRR